MDALQLAECRNRLLEMNLSLWHWNESLHRVLQAVNGSSLMSDYDCARSKVIDKASLLLLGPSRMNTTG